MSINFNYEIISVNEQARCMEIIYTAEGHPTQHIGARLPYEGESLESIVRMYAPVVYWEEIQRAVIPPTVGVFGSIPAADEAAAIAAAVAAQLVTEQQS
jgi:hypothetical protein